MTIEVSSPAFEPGTTIPKKYTGEGQDVSPPLEWSKPTQETKEIAIICDDPDAPTQKPFVHWVIYKIPADREGLPEGGIEGALEGTNDFGGRGYQFLSARFMFNFFCLKTRLYNARTKYELVQT